MTRTRAAGSFRKPPGAAVEDLPRPFDAILIDIQMRHVNGDDVCKKLIGDGFSIPIVAMTGWIDALVYPGPSFVVHTPCCW